MTTFTIPLDPDEADALAGKLGTLATATEWKRAAIVFSRVRVQDSPGRPSAGNVNNDNLLTPTQFARLGIYGLRSRTTVTAYYRAWDHAITDGLAMPVSLGDAVELPDASWEDYFKLTPQTEPFSKSTAPRAKRQDIIEYIDEDDLGLGTCPPMASDVNEGEQVPVSRQGRQRSRPVRQIDSQAMYRNMFNTSLRHAENSAQRALEYRRKVNDPDWSLSRSVLEHIGRIRESLNEIDPIVAGHGGPA